MISLIILTYNSERFIPHLLSSLLLQYKEAVRKKELEIIVADNNSSDDTQKEVKKFSEVLFTQNGGNLGFAAGNNKASEKAKGDILLFVNPDAEFVKGDILKLNEELNSAKVGIVGGEVQDYHGKRELSCGKFYTFFNVLLLSLGLEEALGVRFSPTRKRKVDFVSGAFLAMKTDLFQRLGGFDEHFFMYIEDQELCYRVKKEGLEVLYSPYATIKHLGQGSSNRTFAIVNIYKGLMYFQKKHMSSLSYHSVVFLLKLKATLLVIVGKISNNQYLTTTYEEALKTT